MYYTKFKFLDKQRMVNHFTMALASILLSVGGMGAQVMSAHKTSAATNRNESRNRGGGGGIPCNGTRLVVVFRVDKSNRTGADGNNIYWQLLE